MREFGPIEELLAAIYDRIGHHITADASIGGAKHPPKSKPWPRPVTAIDRAKRRQTMAAANEIVAAFAPHEVKRPT